MQLPRGWAYTIKGLHILHKKLLKGNVFSIFGLISYYLIGKYPIYTRFLQKTTIDHAIYKCKLLLRFSLHEKYTLRDDCNYSNNNNNNNNNNKLAPYGLAVDSYLLPTSKSRDTKTRSKIKNPARYALGIVP